MRCPNPDCRYLKRHGTNAEYRAGVTTCSDCGTALVDIPALAAVTTSASVHTALPSGTRIRLSAGARRALVRTVLAAAIVPLASFVTLPYVDLDALRAYASMPDGSSFVPTSLSIVALGIAPWFVGALLVEIVAAIVPPWRSLRHGAGRARLVRPALVVGVLVALVQAVLLVDWLRSLWLYGEPIVDLYGALPKLVLLVTLTAGACLARFAMHLVEQHGVGNGYAVLVVVGGAGTLAHDLWAIGRAATEGALAPLAVGFVLVGMAVVALLTWRAVQPFDDDVARPSAGTVPAVVALFVPGAAASFLATVDSFIALPDALGPLAMEAWSDGARYALAGVALVAGIPLFARWFSAGASAAARKAALPATVLLNVGLVAFAIVSQRVWVAIDIVFVAFAAACAKDVWMELRARSAASTSAADVRFVALAPYARFTDAERALDALRAAQVPAIARGAHVRALSHHFAALTPIDILVPEGDVEKARAAVA